MTVPLISRRDHLFHCLRRLLATSFAHPILKVAQEKAVFVRLCVFETAGMAETGSHESNSLCGPRPAVLQSYWALLVEAGTHSLQVS